MKRVLLLVLLMVSLAELALEHDRVYLFFSTAALAGLVRTSLISRRHAENARNVAFTRKDGVGKDASACFSAEKAYTSRPHFSEDYYEKAKFTRQSAYTLSDGK